MVDGFYKVEFRVGDSPGRSVMYMHDGKMLGGNSAFAHIGRYWLEGDDVVCELRLHRHNIDPHYTSLLGSDTATLTARGRLADRILRFTGGSEQMPGAVFQSVMTPLNDDTGLAIEPGGNDAIANGLYAIRVRVLDGIDEGLTGVMLLHDGRILGGDAFFYYLGCYTSEAGRWKGEIINQEHTPAKREHPVLGGHEVGIGFAGSYDGANAELQATALAGKRSIRLAARLTLLCAE